MRSAMLLVCLGLAGLSLGGCAVGGFSFGEPREPEATATPSAVGAPGPSVAGNPATARSSGGGGGARGGAATAAARGAAEPVEVEADPLTKARADCWMKVESQKSLRGIDQRIGFVDKCVDSQMKNGPGR
ncbi:MAG: hypothetical protein WCG92_00595 [Hyphomicrobiales bacterium]